jgi:hypothetical protein
MNDLYFIEKGFTKLGEDIYVYKNFLSDEEVSKMVGIFDVFRENKKYHKIFDGTHFENRITEEIEDLSLLVNRIRDMFSKEYKTKNGLTVNVLSEGHSWGEHIDAHDFLEKREMSKLLKDGDPYEVIEDSRYGLVVYFNEVESGGELFYTNQNITYSPKPGDLVVHSAEEICRHGVKEVTKGYRYSYSNFLGVDMKVPLNMPL